MKRTIVSGAFLVLAAATFANRMGWLDQWQA